MHFDDPTAANLKAWLTGRLEPICEADPSVMSDYVIALLKNDRPLDALRSTCREQLEDFLSERGYKFKETNNFSDTNSFVNALFDHLSQIMLVDQGRKHDQRSSGPIVKERSHPQPVPQPDHSSRGRGERGPVGGRSDRGGRDHSYAPYGKRPDSHKPSAPAQKQRCVDYDTQGYCLRGDMCPYDHGDDRIILEDPMIAAMPPGFGRGGVPARGGGPMKRGRGRGRGAPGGDVVAFPDAPSLGTRLESCILVLENVPPESCTEEVVTEWFQKFGKIVKVTVDPVGKRSSVQFDTHEEAQTAYNAPEAIFGNRFVKVYFYKPKVHGPLPGMGPEARFTQDRTAEVAAAIEAARQAANMVKMDTDVDMDGSEKLTEEEVKARMAELEALKQKEEQIKRAKLEMQIKLAKLQAKQSMAAGGPAVPAVEAQPVASPTTPSTSALKEALAAKVAELKAAAADMGVPDPTARLYPATRGRGAPRGRGGPPRGGMMGGGRKLDLRTKKITVANVALEHKDQIEQHFGAFGTIVGVMFEGDKAIVEFSTRLEAETAMAKGTKVGEDRVLTLAWHQDRPSPTTMVEVTNTQ